MIVGLDPGKRSPAHVLCTRDISLEFVKHSIDPFTLSEPHETIVFVEGQFPQKKVGMQSLMTLSFHAGLQAGAYMQQGCKCYSLPPKQWRELVLQNTANNPKQVFQNKAIRANLVPEIVVDLGNDAIDAWLIALAGSRLILRNEMKKAKKIGWRS